MAKFYGKVGYASTVETSPGLWQKVITEKNCYGELVRNARRLVSSGSLNGDINIANQVSIIADAFATDNYFNMLYIEYMGALWNISNVEVQFPRLILTIGGVYNG